MRAVDAAFVLEGFRSPVHLRAAVPEAAAQSLPIHGLGQRAGAPEAAAELDELLARLLAGPPDPDEPSDPAEAHQPAPPTDVHTEAPADGV